MLKAIRMAIKYKHLIPELVGLVELIYATGKDGKITKQERGKLISEFMVFAKKVKTDSK